MDTWFKIDICLIYWNTVPIITYGIDDRVICTSEIKEKITVSCQENFAAGPHKFWIEFRNKNYKDCILDKNLDMAVEIQSVSFEGMTFDRFKWAGEYYPDYPADYPNKQPVVPHATYLGWNGRWELPFTTPIFTWIHRLENLGWLYEP